jgi:peptidoglycan/LPS O-acetylase OafA/YrhL
MALPTPSRVDGKDESIETLRGIAIALIVMLHCIPEVGIASGHVGYDHFAYSFRLIRVPLFTAISGYIYAMHALTPGKLQPFVFGKVRRLLLPWVTVTLLTLALRGLAHVSDGHAQGDLLQAFWMPIGHLWFLPAMLWVFLTVAVLEEYGWLATFRDWLVVCALAWTAAIFLQGSITALAFSGYLLIFPFFLFGLGAKRFPAQLFAPRALTAYAILAVAGLGIHQMIWFGAAKLTEVEYNVLVLVTVYATQGLIFRHRRAYGPLARLGHYSYPIYLFHLIAIGVAVRVAQAIQATNEHALFALKLAFGLALPLLATLAVSRVPLLNLVLLGEPRGRRQHGLK